LKCFHFHGEIPYQEREKNWKDFLAYSSHEPAHLVCTDIASRGLDTTMVDHVVLFDFPLNATDYLHRIGRTARAGKKGFVTCLLTKKDEKLSTMIKKVLEEGKSLEHLLVADKLEFGTINHQDKTAPTKSHLNLKSQQPAEHHRGRREDKLPTTTNSQRRRSTSTPPLNKRIIVGEKKKKNIITTNTTPTKRRSQSTPPSPSSSSSSRTSKSSNQLVKERAQTTMKKGRK
jgi:superfamily II DNA/RNA helicase